LLAGCPGLARLGGKHKVDVCVVRERGDQTGDFPRGERRGRYTMGRPSNCRGGETGATKDGPDLRGKKKKESLQRGKDTQGGKLFAMGTGAGQLSNRRETQERKKSEWQMKSSPPNPTKNRKDEESPKNPSKWWEERGG